MNLHICPDCGHEAPFRGVCVACYVLRSRCVELVPMQSVKARALGLLVRVGVGALCVGVGAMVVRWMLAGN